MLNKLFAALCVIGLAFSVACSNSGDVKSDEAPVEAAVEVEEEAVEEEVVEEEMVEEEAVEEEAVEEEVVEEEEAGEDEHVSVEDAE